MSNCFDNYSLENIDASCNVELVAGISELEIYGAIASHVENMPELPEIGSTGTTLEQLATLTGDITFPASSGKGFFKIGIMSDTGEVKHEGVGNKGNKKFKNTFEFYIPGTEANNLGFARQYVNTPMIFVVREKSGRLRLLGNKLIPAYMETIAGTTGKKVEDDTGTNYIIEQTAAYPAPIYTGALTLAEENVA